jgi:hypothetical protein
MKENFWIMTFLTDICQSSPMDFHFTDAPTNKRVLVVFENGHSAGRMSSLNLFKTNWTQQMRKQKKRSERRQNFLKNGFCSSQGMSNIPNSGGQISLTDVERRE